jgi:nitrogen fixation/metabolism regulation signal transduction histidine kinase
VLHNLLLNARDALSGRTKPVISILTRGVHAGEQPYVELVVRDNGPGFPESLMERLFEPYVTDKEKGTGLGLAIVKRIIEEHGGSIQAENLTSPSATDLDDHSPSEGGGAGITIRLPVNRAAAGAAEESNNHFNTQERGSAPKGKSKRTARASRGNPARTEKHA